MQWLTKVSYGMEIFLGNIEDVNAVWFESPDTVEKLLELWKKEDGPEQLHMEMSVWLRGCCMV